LSTSSPNQLYPADMLESRIHHSQPLHSLHSLALVGQMAWLASSTTVPRRVAWVAQGARMPLHKSKHNPPQSAALRAVKLYGAACDLAGKKPLDQSL